MVDASDRGISGIGLGAPSVETRREGLEEGTGEGGGVMALLMLAELVNKGVESDRFGMVRAVRAFNRGQRIKNDVGDNVASLERDGEEGGVEGGGRQGELHGAMLFEFFFSVGGLSSVGSVSWCWLWVELRGCHATG